MIQIPTIAALITTASTAPLLPNAVVILFGIALTTIIRGFLAAVPVACVKSIALLVNTPALYATSPASAAITMAHIVVNIKYPIVLPEIRPNFFVSEICIIASTILVNTIGMITTCNARTNNCPTM